MYDFAAMFQKLCEAVSAYFGYRKSKVDLEKDGRSQRAEEQTARTKQQDEYEKIDAAIRSHDADRINQQLDELLDKPRGGDSSGQASDTHDARK